MSEPTTLEFHLDGGVTVRKLESGEIQLGSFRVVDEETVVIDGTEFEGRAKVEVAFMGDELRLTLMRLDEESEQVIRGTYRIDAPSDSGLVSEPESAPQDGIYAGVQVYHEMGCGVCHELDIAGSAGDVGPSLDDMAAVAVERIESADYAGEATTAEEYIREGIVEPDAHIVEGFPNVMPAYATIPEEDVEAMVELLLQQ